MGVTMNIFQRIQLAFSQSKLDSHIQQSVKRELDSVPDWLALTAEAYKWNIPDPSIYATQADLYRLDPNLGTALDVLSNEVATSKFNVRRMRGEDVRDIPNHEFEMLLRVPNPLQSGLEFIRDTVCNYKLNGNSIWWLNREDADSKPLEMWTIPYSRVKPVPDGNLFLAGYDYYPGGGRPPIRLETWEVVHFKTYNPDNPYAGLSPLESLGQTIAADMGMRKTSATAYTERNGAPPSILAFRDFVNNEAWQDIKAETRRAAVRNEMMMLRGVGDGVSWLSRAVSNKDMEYIATLKQNMTDIFNRICPGLVAMLSENATEANSLAARATYNEKTLWVMMEAISQKITSDILPAYGLKLVGNFDDPRVVDRRMQLDEQTAFERTHTIEEVRKKYYQDDPLGDERDRLFVSELTASPLSEPPAAPPSPPPDIVEDTGAEDVSAKAAIEELKRWRRMALQGVTKETKAAKAVGFVSDILPLSVMDTIKKQLAMFPADRDAIAGIFDRAIERMKPKPHADPTVILRSIEAAVRAKELERVA